MLNRFSKYRQVTERSNAHLLFGTGHFLSLSLSLSLSICHHFSNKNLVWCQFQVNRKSFAHGKLLSTFVSSEKIFYGQSDPLFGVDPLPSPPASHEAATSEIERRWYKIQNDWIRFEFRYMYVFSIYSLSIYRYFSLSYIYICRKV